MERIENRMVIDSEWNEYEYGVPYETEDWEDDEPDWDSMPGGYDDWRD